MSLENLEQAFVEQLRDIYYAEKKILKSLPQMAKKTQSDQLRAAYESHQQQTERQVERIEQVFELLDLKPRSKKCEAIDGILSEGKEIMSEEAEPEVLDAMLIAAAQKVEHYEIATYGTLCTWAKTIGLDRQIARLLGESLAEEEQTDRLLTKIAKRSINEAAAAPPEHEEAETEEEASVG